VIRPPDTICSVDGCTDLISSHKYVLCGKHHTRFLKHGDPLVNKRPDLGVPLAERFWSKVDKSDPHGCWMWTASLNRGGYGQFIVMRGSRGYPKPAHRVAWEFLRGEIPGDLVVDHLCRNRACVNPGHMELVTNDENIKRGVWPAVVNARKTHCIRGHPFDEDNTYRAPSGGRQCRVCMKLRRKRRQR
jgi:hypothetical protein